MYKKNELGRWTGKSVQEQVVCVLKQPVVLQKSLHVWYLLSVFSGLYDGSSGVHRSPKLVSSPSTLLQCDNIIHNKDNDYGLAVGLLD